MRRLVAIALLALGCGTSGREYSVCLQLGSDEYNEQARRGIDWWGERVTYECGPQSIDVIQSDPLPQSPFAMGWFDGETIGWIRGPIYPVVRHEAGHMLGFGDSNDPGSAMYSGAVAEELTPQ